MDKWVVSFAAKELIRLHHDHQLLLEMCGGLEAFLTNGQWLARLKEGASIWIYSDLWFVAYVHVMSHYLIIQQKLNVIQCHILTEDSSSAALFSD